MNENEITETFEYVIKATDKGYSIIPQNRVTNTYSVKKLEKHYGPDKVAAERGALLLQKTPDLLLPIWISSRITLRASCLRAFPVFFLKKF